MTTMSNGTNATDGGGTSVVETERDLLRLNVA